MSDNNNKSKSNEGGEMTRRELLKLGFGAMGFALRAGRLLGQSKSIN